MSAKGTAQGDADGRGAAQARPVRKTRTAKAMRNFYAPAVRRREVPSVGRFADRFYDPVTGRRVGQP
jgi:hypothetical protein